MLTFTCSCGHLGPFPEETTTLVCSQCGKRTEVIWLPDRRLFSEVVSHQPVFDQWKLLSVRRQARKTVLSPSPSSSSPLSPAAP